MKPKGLPRKHTHIINGLWAFAKKNCGPSTPFEMNFEYEIRDKDYVDELAQSSCSEEDQEKTTAPKNDIFQDEEGGHQASIDSKSDKQSNKENIEKGDEPREQEEDTDDENE